MDFHIEGVSLANIRKAALSMRAGGVGYYPSSNFVHIDTGPSGTGNNETQEQYELSYYSGYCILPELFINLV